VYIKIHIYQYIPVIGYREVLTPPYDIHYLALLIRIGRKMSYMQHIQSYRCSHTLKVCVCVCVQGIEIPLDPQNITVVDVKEVSFLDNPKVPDAIKHSRVEVVPESEPRAKGAANPFSATALQLSPLPNGQGMRVEVPWPLNTQELAQVSVLVE